MNAGLNSRDAVCSSAFIDADTMIEPDALLRMVSPSFESDDVVAAAARSGSSTAPRSAAGAWYARGRRQADSSGIQAVEYCVPFSSDASDGTRLGGNLIISGAFGLFRREAVIAVGGYLHDTVGEDMELIVRLRRRAVRDGSEPERRCSCRTPWRGPRCLRRLRVLARQRDRWHRGLADMLWRHRRLFLNPRYRAMGMLAYPYFFFVELLAPVIEAFGLLALPAALLLDAVNWQFALLLLILAYGYGMLLTTCSLLLEELSSAPYAASATACG